jgi:hypothetical protein
VCHYEKWTRHSGTGVGQKSSKKAYFSCHGHYSLIDKVRKVRKTTSVVRQNLWRKHRVSVALCVIVGAVSSFGTVARAAEVPAPEPIIVTNTSFSPMPGGFVPIVPRRVLDTRTGAKIAPNGEDGRTSLRFLDPKDPEIPVGQVGAVTLNITAVDPDGPGYLLIWDPSVPYSGTSVLNYSGRDVTANTLTLSVTAAPRLIYMSSQSTHLLIDVTGWYTKQPKKAQSDGRLATVPTVGGGYVPADPTRIYDSRPSGVVPPNQPRRVTLPPSVAVPEAGISALVVNVTSTGADGDGWASFYPSGTAAPNTSSINYRRGDLANQITVKVSDGNAIDFFVSVPTNIVVDLVGYYTAGATGAGGFVAIQPTRVMDTRSAFGNYGLEPGHGALELIVGGSAAVPRSANAISANITAVNPSSAGFVTVWPDGQAQPTASNLNYRAGETLANGITIGLGNLKGLDVYRTGDPALIVDVNGYFTSPYVVV